MTVDTSDVQLVVARPTLRRRDSMKLEDPQPIPSSVLPEFTLFVAEVEILNFVRCDWSLETSAGEAKVSSHFYFILFSTVCTRKTRVLDVVYNASNNELVRTKTLVKNSIVQIDATPYRAWYEQHYGVKVGLKKAKKTATEEEVVDRLPSILFANLLVLC